MVTKNPELERELQEMGFTGEAEKQLLALFASMATKKRKEEWNGNNN